MEQLPYSTLVPGEVALYCYLLMTLTRGTPVYIPVLLSSDDLDKGNTCIHPCVVILWRPWQGEHLYTSLCCYLLMTLTRGTPVYIPVLLSYDDLDKGNTCIHPCVVIFWWPWQGEHLYTSLCCYLLMTLTRGTPVYIPVLLSSDDLDKGNTCIHPCVVILWWPWQGEHLYTSLCCYLLMTLTRGTPVYIPVLLSSDDLDKGNTCIHPCVVIFWWPWQWEHLYTSLYCYLLMTLTRGTPVYIPVLLSSDDLDNGSTCIHPCVVILWWPWQGEHLYTSLCCYLLMTLTRGAPVYIPVLLSSDDLDKRSTCIHHRVVIFWWPWQKEHLYTSLCSYLLMTLTRGTLVYIPVLLSYDVLDKGNTCIHPCVVIFWWPWQGEHLYTSLCCYLLMTLTRGAPVYIPVLLSYDVLDKGSTCIHPCVVILWCPWQGEHLYTSLCCYLLMTLTRGTPVYIPVFLSSDDLDKGNTCIHPCVVILWWPWQEEHLYTTLCCYLMMTLTRGTPVYIPVLLSYDDLDKRSTCIHPCVVIFWWPWQGEHLYTSLCSYLLMTLTRGTPVYIPVLLSSDYIDKGNTCIQPCVVIFWWPWQGEHRYTSLCCYLLMTLTMGTPVYIPVLLSYDDLDKGSTCIHPCVVILWWPWQEEHLYTSLCCYLMMTLTRGAPVYIPVLLSSGSYCLIL